MKKLVILFMVVFAVIPLMAAQRFVLAEQFTGKWWGQCHVLRSGLTDRIIKDIDKFPYLVLFTWHADRDMEEHEYVTPGGYNRSTDLFYDYSFYPALQWDGLYNQTNLNQLIPNYNTRKDVSSPMTLDIDYEILYDEDKVILTVTAELDEDITDGNHRLYFMVAQDLNYEVTGGAYNVDAVYRPYLYYISAFNQTNISFPLRNTGEKQVFTREMELRGVWLKYNFTAIAFVQTHTGS